MSINRRGQIADTGFWLAAFDPTDGHHESAAGLLEDLSHVVLLMPWPIMYEVLRTRTVKHSQMMAAFETVVRQPKVRKIPDEKYRDDCLQGTFETARRGRPISLVDMVVRAILQDRAYHITQLLTYNHADFVDVCRQRRIAIWPVESSRA